MWGFRSANKIQHLVAVGGEIKNQTEFDKNKLASSFMPNSHIQTQSDLIVLLLDVVQNDKATLEWFVCLGAVTKVSQGFQTLICGLLQRLLKFPMLRCVNFGELDTLLSPTHWKSVIPFLLDSNVIFFYVCCGNAEHVFRAFQDNPEKAAKRMAFFSDKTFFCREPPMCLHLLGSCLHPNTGKYQPGAKGKIMHFLVEEVISGGADLASTIKQWWEMQRSKKRSKKRSREELPVQSLNNSAMLKRESSAKQRQTLDTYAMAQAAVKASKQANATQNPPSELGFEPVD